MKYVISYVQQLPSGKEFHGYVARVGKTSWSMCPWKQGAQVMSEVSANIKLARLLEMNQRLPTIFKKEPI